MTTLQLAGLPIVYPGQVALAHGALVAFVAPPVATTLYQLTPTRRCALFALHFFNNSGADVFLEVGTGLAAAFARVVPRFRLVNGQPNFFSLVDGSLPYVEFAVDITALTSAGAAAPALEGFASVIEW